MFEQLKHAHFLRPGWLYLLLPFAFYAGTLLLRARARSPWAGFVAPTLLPHLLGQTTRRLRFGPGWLLVLLGSVASLCAAGPVYRVQENAGDPSKSPLIVVFELSRTMGKTDVSPSRCERARLEIKDLLHARSDSPVALVVVAGTAHVLMPLTDDAAVLDPYLDALSPELMPFDGEAFEKAAVLVKRLAQSTADPLAVLVVSDGMPPSGAQALGALHKSERLSLSVLGVGAGGADETGLKRLAEDGGGTYVPLSYGSRDVGRLLTAVEQARALTAPRADARYWHDEGPLLALGILVGLAFWFRRGFVLGRLTLVGLALLLSGCTPAIEGLWLTPDQQGRLAFERGDYLTAAARFDDPTWKGLSFYAAGKWDQAAAVFVGRDDPASLFNLGNAYAQGGKLQSALNAYDRALQKAPTNRATRKNADRIRRLLRSLQEDTDAEDAKHPESGNDDAATQVDPSALAPHTEPPPSAAAAEAKSEAGDLEEKIWLGRLTTEPTEFLKRKLAVLAAREQAQ